MLNKEYGVILHFTFKTIKYIAYELLSVIRFHKKIFSFNLADILSFN